MPGRDLDETVKVLVTQYAFSLKLLQKLQMKIEFVF